MSETVGVNVLKRAYDMEISPQFDGYSAVRIFVGTDDDGNEVVIEAGNTDGRTLEIKNPFGTQEMADRILADITGYQYQPLSATNALLNPAAEMGDGVTVNGVYSGLFTRATQFGRLMASDISAPTDEEIDHEFAIESPSDRQYTRFVQQTKSMLKITNLAIEAEVAAREAADTEIRATLTIHAGQIAARVTKTGGSQSSFGWVLNDNSHTWYSGSQEVMRVNSSGLYVKGEIRATSGVIGGFTIGTSSIYSNGMSSMSSTQTTGVHVGTDGIKLGQNFRVTTSGNVSANNMTLTGTLTLGGAMITASDLRQGANYANIGHNSWDSAYSSTSPGGYCYGGAGGGYSWNNAKVGNETAEYLRARTMVVDSSMTLFGHGVGAYTAVISGVTIPYFGWGAPY